MRTFLFALASILNFVLSSAFAIRMAVDKPIGVWVWPAFILWFALAFGALEMQLAMVYANH